MQPTSIATKPARLWQFGLAAALFALFAALAVQYALKVQQPGHRSAIERWLPQIRQLGRVDIYQAFNYPNPPIMALLLRGLAALPPLAAGLCWFGLKVGMTALAFFWVCRLVETSERPFPLGAKVLTVLLSLRPIMGDLFHGNVNLFILFLVAGSVYAFCRGRDVLAGVVLGLAIACKVTPALFVPYFLWKRAWRTLAGCAAGLLLFLWVIPGLALGTERNVHDLSSWWKGMVQPYIGGVVTTDHPNQSLPGVVFRLGSHSPSFYGPTGEPLRYDNLLDVDPYWLRLAVKACMALFAGLVLWTCRTPRGDGGWRLAAEFSLVTVGMLLFSERTWKHHCVTLLFPFAVIAYHLAVCRPGPRLKAFLIGATGAVFLLMATTSTTLWKGSEEVAKQAQVYGAYAWAHLILVGVLAVLLRQRERPEPTPDLSAPT